MGIMDLPEALLEGEGVIFQYLLLAIESDGQSRHVVRGVRYAPYSGGADEQILGGIRRELAESEGKCSVEGGGSLTLNPYNETIMLFGKNSAHGPEPDRAISARAVEQVFPDHKVSWFPPENKPPAKAAAKKASEQASSG